jgi:hypothetical protein
MVIVQIVARHVLFTVNALALVEGLDCRRVTFQSLNLSKK